MLIRFEGRTRRTGSSSGRRGIRSPIVAVLPFANMSADKEQDFLCDGIAEEIINDLSRVQGLHVVARTSSFAFRGTNLDIRQIGRKTRCGQRSRRQRPQV